jgi:CheY-like chemotaxis protein
MANVLVIEDDLSLLGLLTLMLEDFKHEVHGATNARQALTAAKRHQLDLIVSDIRIEGDVDGLSTLEQIKASQPEVLTVVMTGFAIDDAPLRAVKIQVDDYLNKPFGEDDFLNTIDRLLTAKRRRLRFDGILQSLRSLPGKISEAWESARKNQTDQGLQRHRDGFYQALYTLVRSKKLTCRAALNCWDQLEAIERGFLRYQADPEKFQPEQVRKGAEAYAQLFAKMSRMAEMDESGSMMHTFPFAKFKAFYDRLQSGVLALEELRLAMALWFADGDTSTAHTQESLEIRNKIWGESDVKKPPPVLPRFAG